MSEEKKKQRVVLGIAFFIVLIGLVLLVCDLSGQFEVIKLFGTLNLGIVLIVIGAVITFLTPKPGRKKKKYRGF